MIPLKPLQNVCTFATSFYYFADTFSRQCETGTNITREERKRKEEEDSKKEDEEKNDKEEEEEEED